MMGNASLSVEKVEQKTKDLIDEFLHGADTKEALLCARELNSPGHASLMVTTALNHVLERSEVARKQTGALMHDLVKEKVVGPDDLKKGVDAVLEFVEDLEIDIPQVWTYLGQMLGPMVDVKATVFPLTHFKDIAAPLIKIKRGGKLMGAVLSEAKSLIGAGNVAEIWTSSGITWKDFVGKDDRQVDDIVKKYGLEFTVTAPTPSPAVVAAPAPAPTAAAAAAAPSPAVNLEKIQKQLEDMMKKADDDEIDKWIQGVVGPKSKEIDFLRALMTAVVSSALSGESTNTRYNADVIKRHVKLLHKYLDRSVLLEVQALYALQALVNSLQHPPGLLQHIFDTLYDEDIISEEAFNTWHNSEDPKENEGKGVALKSVVQFFVWLREAEEDDSGASESEMNNQS